MAKILIASVPLSGHVNPAVPIAKLLVNRGHEVSWYCGMHYRQQIENTGALFFPYQKAKDFHDSIIQKEFPDLPEKPLFRHASFYIKHVFYDNLKGQYEDLCEILKTFHADILLTDEWFTGAIPLAEKKSIRWVVYCNSPMFYFDDEVPFPGAGIFPRKDLYGRNRNRIVNWMVTKIIFGGVQKYINKIRKTVELPPMHRFFLINNIFLSELFIKFNTPAFDFTWKSLPKQVRYVGPVIPESNGLHDFDVKILDTNKPIVFITQGSINIENYEKLIIPALRALVDMDVFILVATGKKNYEALLSEFSKPNIIIREYMPYAQVLPKTDVMITNGGFGGVITALYYAVPLVVAADTEDKPEIAARVEYFKVGINLGTGKPKSEKIRKAVQKIFSNPIFKSNAQKISKDFHSHNAPLETVMLLEELLHCKS